MKEDAVSPLQVRQIASAVELIRASMPEDLLKFMIYGQSGIAEFLRTGIELGSTTSRAQAFVIPGFGDEVIAYAEFTFPQQNLAHLAYLAVAPRARGRGFATQLIREFITTHEELAALELNVFSNNLVARQLYERLGFVYGGSSIWRLRALPNAHGTVKIEDFETSLASHSRFGFSQMQIESQTSPITVGRMGDEILRIYSAEDFVDDNLLAAIRGVFPSTQAAFMVDNNSATNKAARIGTVLAESIKMRLPFVEDDRLIDQLRATFATPMANDGEVRPRIG